MAYAAIISLANTIDRILNHNRLSISLAENQQILSLLEYVNSFQAFLEKFPDKFNTLEGRMREMACEAEDIIEYFMSEQVSSWPNYQTEESIHVLKLVIENINLSGEVREIKDSSSNKEIQGGVDSSALISSSSTDPPICQDAMVGFEDYATDLKERLCGEPSNLQVIPICGMAGIGKTTLARNVYHDPLIVDHFVIRVWVTISQYYSVQRTVSSLLDSLKEFNTGGLGQSDGEKVYKILMGRKYLVVMDDIWSSKAWDGVRKVFPDDGNGSRIMLTTRLSYVASYPDPSSKLYEMGLLDADQSWDLLKQNVFKDEDFPSELEDIGKEIARRCKGWPLPIVAIAGLLSTNTTSLASWQEIAEEIFKDPVFEKVFSSSCDESGCLPSGKNELQLQKVIEKIALIDGEVKEINGSSSLKEVQCDAVSFALSSTSTAPPIRKDAMVGLEDHALDLKDRLCEESSKLQVIPICGMGGIGKTTLARNVYDDPLIVENFVIRAWVTISQDYSAQRILSGLLESLKEFNSSGLGQSDDEKIHKILMGRRYLVVMDDIWSSEAWDVARRVFPDDGNGSRVVLTTRLSDVASYPDPSSKIYEMGLLDADQSWNLLKQKVFKDEDCPSKLEYIGKEIARSCKGLPLAIVVIAGLLSTTRRNLASWKVIAEKVKSAQIAEYDQIEEILSLSYVQLPQYLRPCFLYMGSFPEDDDIHAKKLIRLWVAEGFVKSPSDYDSFEKAAEECLEELVKRNLVLVTKWKWDGRIKSCSLHDLMRDLCIRKAYESRLFLNLMDRQIEKELFIESITNQRRVSVDSSNLKFLSSLYGSTIHSIKCSRNHSGKLDFLESVGLLRVLDAEPLDVQSLPSLVQLHELFHLRYLAFRYYGDIPTALLMLQNLQTLVIRKENRSDIGVLVTSSLQLTWCMPKLRHVYYRGTILFDDPVETDCPLESLQTLSYVSHKSCTERILKMIPNLKKLKINCSRGVHEGAAWMNDLVHLHRLESLAIFADQWFYGQRPKYYTITFPRMLKKLTLVELTLPWNDIFVVGSLPNLQVLRVLLCPCVGDTWETTEGAFPELELLQIENSRLENWITESSHFPKLKFLMLCSCWDLKEIPNDIGEIPTLEQIRVMGDAKKSLVDSVEQIQKEQEEFGNNLRVLCTVKSPRP